MTIELIKAAIKLYNEPKKMITLEKFINLNSLKTQNRMNRLEDKLKQQEYYGDKEDLFDPLTKT